MHGQGSDRPRKDTLKQVLRNKPTSLAQAHLVALGTMQKCRRRLDEHWQTLRGSPAARDVQCEGLLTSIGEALGQVADSERDTLRALDESIHRCELLRARLQAELGMRDEAGELLALLAALRAVQEHLTTMLSKHA